MVLRRLLPVLVLVAVVAAAALSPAAGASELIDRNATGVKLAVNAQGQALVSYRVTGRTRNVLAWGAVNAIAPTQGQSQVKFRLDYSGGWGTYRRDISQAFVNVCAPYDGPPLQWVVTACKARDGSYWALQSWQRALPNYGLRPTPKQAVWELRLSHWKGPLPVLEIKMNWAYRRYDHMFGRFNYGGKPVHGFRSTPAGVPLDTFGRNIYVDVRNSVYGRGWKRENSFLTHKGTGTFCYGLFPHGPQPSGIGDRYRATVIGPGVTPDMYWEGQSPGPYTRDADLVANEEIRRLGDPLCKPN